MFADDDDAENALSPEQIESTICEYREILSEYSPARSPPLPFRQMADRLKAMLYCDSSSLKVIELYMTLLSKCSLSYDDVLFSTCVHSLTSMLKAVASCTACTALGSMGKKNSMCDSHVASGEYVRAWRFIVRDCITTESFDLLSNYGLVSHLVRALADVLHFANLNELLKLACDAFTYLLRLEHGDQIEFVISCIYKSCFPVLVGNVAVANRNAVVDVLSLTCRAESLLSDATGDAMVIGREYEDEDQDQDEEMVSRAHSKESNPEDGRNEETNDATMNTESTTSSMAEEPRARPLIQLFKVCCLQVADKAEDRKSLAGIMHQVLRGVREPSYNVVFVKALRKLCKSSKASTRLVSLDMASRLLADGTLPQRDATSLVSAIAQRCSDKMGNVRAKATALLLETVSAEGFAGSGCAHAYVHSVSKAVCDTKSSVRKASVDFIGFVAVSILEGSPEDGAAANASGRSTWLDIVAMLSDRCTDKVATVRLAAANELSRIVHAAANTSVTAEGGDKAVIHCLETILPLLDDVDSRCRTCCLKLVSAVLVGDFSRSDGGIDVSELWYSLLGGYNRIIVRLGERAVFTVAKDGTVDKGCVRRTCGLVDTNAPSPPTGADTGKRERVEVGVWASIAALACGGLVETVWQCLGERVVMREVECMRNTHVFKVVLEYIPYMSGGMRKRVEESLDGLLFRGECSSSGGVGGDGGEAVVCGISEVLGRLHGDSSRSGDEYLERCASLMDMCDKTMEDEEQEKEKEQEQEKEQEKAAHVLHVIGNVASHMALSAGPGEKLLRFVHSKASDGQARQRALALTTLGKLCLSDYAGSEALTRRFASTFVHALEMGASNACRANATVVLCDLGRRYTSVVEPFVPRLSQLLSDGSSFIRTLVASSLANLVQEDYIKLRPGFIVCQLLKSSLDHCTDVRAIVRYLFTSILPAKHTNHVAIVCFVDFVHVLNDCVHASTYQHFGPNAVRPDICTADPAPAPTESRFKVYDLLLDTMSPEHRAKVADRLTNDVLCHQLLHKMDLDGRGMTRVVEDTLNLVGQIGKRHSRGGRAQDQDQGQGQGQEQERDTETDATAVRKDAVQLRELTVPVLLQVRQLLQSKRSPLLRTLNKCLVTLLSAHRANIHQFIPDTAVRSAILREMDGHANK